MPRSTGPTNASVTTAGIKEEMACVTAVTLHVPPAMDQVPVPAKLVLEMLPSTVQTNASVTLDTTGQVLPASDATLNVSSVVDQVVTSVQDAGVTLT